MLYTNIAEVYGLASYQKFNTLSAPLSQQSSRACLQEWFFFFSSGILDQGEGVLIVFDETPVDKTYESALETIQSMGKVVDSLYEKTKKLH